MGRYVGWFMVFCLSAMTAPVAWGAPQTGKGQQSSGAAKPSGEKKDAQQEKGWLGVEVRNLTPEESAGPAAQGVKVVRIIEGSPAVEVLAGGDLLTSVDGKDIDSAKGMFAIIGGRAPGREVKLGVNHGGKKRVVTLKLGVRPAERTAAKPDAPKPDASASVGGSNSEKVRIGSAGEDFPVKAEASESTSKAVVPGASLMAADGAQSPQADAGATPQPEARQAPPAPGVSDVSGAVHTGDAMPADTMPADTMPATDTAENRPVESPGLAPAPASAPASAEPEPAAPVASNDAEGAGTDSSHQADSPRQTDAPPQVDSPRQADSPQPGDTGGGVRLAAREPQPAPGAAPAALMPPGGCDGVLVVTAGPDGTREPRCVKPGAGRSPESAFRDCPACPAMVVVPAGTFMMGSPKDEGGDKNSGTLEHNKAEDPQHPVTIPAPLAVGKYSVTFDEWDACVADGGCGDYTPGDKGWGRGRRPVINVSWADARSYVKWLGQKTGKDYRLLSEAEREYVTRAGTATPYWWGAAASTERANFSYDVNSGGTYHFEGESDGKFRDRTLPVDDLLPNPWGLHHVHGNVSEWVEDCRHESYKGKPEEIKKTGGAWKVGDCFYHVKRGGGYDSLRIYLRSASRLYDEFDSRQWNTSFRVARGVAP